MAAGGGGWPARLFAGPSSGPWGAGGRGFAPGPSTRAGVPVGPYTIIMQDTTTGSTFADIRFNLVKATVAFSALVPGAAALTLTTTWNIPADLASVNDMVKLTNSQGTVVFWYYTSCKCQTAPGADAAPTGTFAFRLLKLNSVPSGYTLTLHPGGGNVVAAVGPSWIPWAKLGW